MGKKGLRKKSQDNRTKKTLLMSKRDGAMAA